jgi:hypothetical protein
MGKKARIDVRPTVFVLLLLLGAFLVVVPGSTLAAQEGDYTYTISGSPTVANITNYTGAGGDIIIPSTLGGYPVVAIGYKAFYTFPSALTSVTIPSSITSIGNAAFYSCTSLTSLTIGNGVTSIGLSAFAACTNLPSVTIPNSVAVIGATAFDACTNLASVTIGSGVTTIGAFGFPWCTSLTSITFLGLVAPTTVGNGLIENSNPGVRGHAYAASNFPAPGEVWNGLTMGAVIPATEDYTYTVSDGNATITGYTGAGGAIAIPYTLGGYPVLVIGAYAFANHTSLTSVTIPDSVTTIGNSAFQSCTSLTSITIPNGVTTIGKLSFWFCTSLTSVSIPNSVTSIGFGAFDYCTAMTSLTIGSGVTTIGDYAFEQCTALTSVSIPDGVTSIGNMSFFACHMTSVTIGSGVTTIGGNVFSSCHSLTSITFLGLVAPTSVGAGWVNDVAVGVLGHAYAASNFPAPGSVWNGLTMGAVIPTALVAPGAPTNLIATPGNARVILTWQAPASDGGSPITGYKLYRSATSGGTYSLIASPTALTYTDTGLTNGQTYWYKMSAVNAIGVGVNCTAVSALVPQPVSPASDDSMLILVGVVAIAVVLVAVVLLMRRKKK